MSRPRKHDRDLPKYVRIHHGAYQYRGKKLSRVEDGIPAMYDALAKRLAGGELDMIPAAVATFKLEELRNLAPSSRKEHGRLLDIFSNDFREWRVDQVTTQAIKRSARQLFAGKLTAARSYKSRISTFFRWCIADKGLRDGENPCREVWLEKPIATKTKWNDELFWKVRDKLSPMHQCYHDLSFLLYQRTTDVRELDRKQISGGVIHFEPTKTRRSSGRAVDIPITPQIQAVFDRAAEIKKGWKVVSSAIVCTRGGTPYTRSGIYSEYRRADEELHGEGNAIGLNPKSLLPYAMTSAKKSGFTMQQLQEGRAHTSITTTEGYIQQHDTPVSQVLMTLPERPKGAKNG